MSLFFLLYDNLKSFIHEKTKVLGLQDSPFFNNPNNQSLYTVNIRFGKGNRKIIAASPFSRLGKGIVDHKRKTIVFVTPKVAGTSINKFLHQQLGLGKETEKSKGNFHFFDFDYLFDKKSDSSKSEILYWVTYKEYKKYLVIRNPYDRLVSFYTDKFINKMDSYGNDDMLFDKTFLNTIVHITDEFDIDPLNYSFQYFVSKLYEKYKNYEKLWDEHLSLQISSDFKEIALEETEIILLENISDLFTALYPSFKDMHYENRSNLQSTEFVPGAFKLTLSQLKALSKRPNSQSFFSLELEKMVREIYAIDYIVYEKHAKAIRGEDQTNSLL